MRKPTKLTKKELAICSEVERQVTEENEGWVKGYCFVNAQRATLAGDGHLLYHEGYVTTGAAHPDADADGRIHHAWNTINGKLVDFSIPLHFGKQHYVPRHYVAKLYKAQRTFTKEEVLAACKRLNWNWMAGQAGQLKLKENRQTYLPLAPGGKGKLVEKKEAA
jgi:hypothetical protein